jgi:hypothetical protein
MTSPFERNCLLRRLTGIDPTSADEAQQTRHAQKSCPVAECHDIFFEPDTPAETAAQMPRAAGS